MVDKQLVIYNKNIVKNNNKVYTDEYEDIKKVVTIDITPHTIGINTTGGKMVTLIDRNTFYPARKTLTFEYNTDNNGIPYVGIYEGENAFSKDNRLLGGYEISGTKYHVRNIKLEVCVIIDINGCLELKAYDTHHNKLQVRRVI